MRNHLTWLCFSLLFVAGCATVGQKPLTREEEKTLAVQLKEVKAIAETSLEISKNSDRLAKDAFDKSSQANATAEKAFATSQKAVDAVNETREFATKEAERAITAANEASEKAIEASNRSAKMAMEYADKAAEKAISAANEAINKANAAIERANELSEKAVALCNQTIAEINRERATKKMAPPEEPILEKEPEIRPQGKTYRVQPGDTLGKIAAKFYGNAGRWPTIYKNNKQVIKDPNRLKPGMELLIPPDC